LGQWKLDPFSNAVRLRTHPKSTAGKMADYTVNVKGRTKLKGEKDFLLRQMII